MIGKEIEKTCCLCKKTYSDYIAKSNQDTCSECFAKIHPYSFNRVRKKAFLSMRFQETEILPFSGDFKNEILNIIAEDEDRLSDFTVTKVICNNHVYLDETSRRFYVTDEDSGTKYKTLVYNYTDLVSYNLDYYYYEYDGYHYLDSASIIFEFKSKYEKIFKISFEFENAALEIKKKKNIEKAAAPLLRELQSAFGIAPAKETKSTF